MWHVHLPSNVWVHLHTEWDFIYVTENILRLVYKEKHVNPLGGNNDCLLWEFYETHSHCGQNAEYFDVTAGGTYSYQRELNIEYKITSNLFQSFPVDTLTSGYFILTLPV
jgi:hypothetical protein